MIYHQPTDDTRFDDPPICECKPCPDCDGEGCYKADVPRIGYRLGTGLVEANVTCGTCGGSGKIKYDCDLHG